jgi:flagellar basal-body rod protein FlgC
MSLLDSFRISGSALTAERLRMDAIASNLANLETTRTPEGGPYRRQKVVFAPFKPPGTAGVGVQVSALLSEDRFRRVYDPGHPDADADGFVTMPDINLATEMTDLLSAVRAYEANVSALSALRQMAQRALEIGR